MDWELKWLQMLTGFCYLAVLGLSGQTVTSLYKDQMCEWSISPSRVWEKARGFLTLNDGSLRGTSSSPSPWGGAFQSNNWREERMVCDAVSDHVSTSVLPLVTGLTFSSCSMQMEWTTILQAAHFFRATDFCCENQKKREIRFTLIQNTKWTIKKELNRDLMHIIWKLKLCNAFCKPATRGQHYTKRETISEKEKHFPPLTSIYFYILDHHFAVYYTILYTLKSKICRISLLPHYLLSCLLALS